jgi:hypothetical protein
MDRMVARFSSDRILPWETNFLYKGKATKAGY